MSEFNPNVDFYFNNSKKWKKELLKLREILLETNLDEELKWGSPCYTSNNRNIVLIHEFKDVNISKESYKKIEYEIKK